VKRGRPGIKDRGDVGTLTPVERLILGLVAEGYAHEEIAAQLGYARGTVGNKMMRIADKLAARDRVHAVAIYLTAVARAELDAERLRRRVEQIRDGVA
jgi:DNA-binding CsgD family transcriptional regulator